MRSFADVRLRFRGWVSAFDSGRETVPSVVAALDGICVEWTVAGAATPALGRIFKADAEWQAVRRRVAGWFMDGYATAAVANEDGTATTRCSFAYDLADFDELLANAPDDEVARARYLAYVDWPYMLSRIRACRDAVLTIDAAHLALGPFDRLSILGRRIRFVSWRTSSSTHVSEDPETIRGASTLCGGRLAYHLHTQEQWSRYACVDCFALVRGSADPYASPDTVPARLRASYANPALRFPLVHLRNDDSDATGP